MRVEGPEALIFALAGLMIFAAAPAFAAEGEKAGEVTIATRFALRREGRRSREPATTVTARVQRASDSPAVPNSTPRRE